MIPIQVHSDCEVRKQVYFYFIFLFISFQPSKGGKYDMHHSGTKVHINETASTALKLIALGPCVHK